ncbi:alpha/beta hydrolase family protein [Nocardia sp. NPDC006044]|uniref:alpha/beta hydrolase family protein n=1 Tax=Nocardia sp. NPDC006044 TaxID=3364306 RepID=UPI0036C720FE
MVSGTIRRAWKLGLATLLAVVAVIVGNTATEPVFTAAVTLDTAPAVPGVPLRIAYGSSPDMFGDLYLPTAAAAPYPVVVLIHGGGWSQNRTLDHVGPLAASLAEAGVAVWNIEYRRVNGAGGWPITLTDADDAVRSLATVVNLRSGNRLDLRRVHLAGHSAGGQLAAWVAGRQSTEARATAVRIRSVTLMAAVLDLEFAVNNGRDGFVRKLLGGRPDDVPDRYRMASPIAHLPVGVRISALHGDRDTVVAPAQSRRYVAAAQRAGETADLRILDGTGHGEFADANSTAWAAARETILANVNELR